MIDSKKNGNNKPDENLFQIMEGIIHQLNKTKKIFVTLLIAHLIIVPAIIITIIIVGTTFAMTHPFWQYTSDNGPWPKSPFPIIPAIAVIAVAIWLGVGIKQWLALSKWTKKYKLYKEMQEKIDAKLDYEDDEDDTEDE